MQLKAARSPGFIARRAVVSVALQWDSLNGLLRGTCVVVLVACALARVAIWLGSRLVIASLGFLVATYCVASLIEIGQAPPTLRSWNGAQLAVALPAAVGLVKLAGSNEHEACGNHASNTA